MKRTIGMIPSSYQVSMSYEEQVEEIRNKVKQILDDNNIIIENYNEIIEQYDIINQKYDDIIVDYEELLSNYQNLLDKINANTTAIGTLDNLNTTEKSNIVGAINEVNSKCNDNTSNISALQDDVSSNTEEINDIKEGYLPLIGGNLSGNLEIGDNTDTSDKSVRIFNSNQDTYFIIKSDGRIGIWSNTLNRYILLEDTSGNLNLNNSKITIENSGIVNLTNDLRYDGGNNNSYIYIGNNTANKIKEYQTENSSIKVGSGTDTNGAFRIYDYTHSKDILRDSNGTITFNGSANGNILNKNVARGVVSITPSASNTPTSVNVSWPSMDGIPSVVAIPNVGDGLTAIYNVGATDITKTGCKLWLRASNTNARNVMYIAIYK